MFDNGRLSRRQMLLGLTGAAGAAILVACGDAAPAAPTAGAAPAAAATTAPAAATTAPAAGATTAPAAMATTAPATGATTVPAAMATTGAAATTAPAMMSGTATKLTYWGGLIFSDDANNWQVQAIKDWAKQNKLEIDVVMINQNETNMKVAAAVESKTMPDGLDLGLDLLLLLTNQNQLLDLSDTYTKIGAAHGGWLKSVDTALDKAKFSGQRAGLPYGTGGNVIFRRTDLLMKAGVTTDAPKMWTDIGTAAEKTTKPPIYGMGFALSNVGDGNTQVQVLQSWGGRIADDAGKMVTLKSAATKEYLQWVTDLFKKKTFPPGATTWDGAGDNNAYQAGQAVFIANTGSVSVWMRANDKELLASTQYSAMPSGPKMRVSPGTPVIRGIPKTSKNADAMKALFEYLSSKEFTAKYYPLAIYGPVLQDETTQDIFKTDPVHQGLADLGINGTAPGFPDVNNTAYADFNNNYLVPKMIQRVVIDNYDLDKAIDEAQKAGETIYAKYNK